MNVQRRSYESSKPCSWAHVAHGLVLLCVMMLTASCNSQPVRVVPGQAKVVTVPSAPVIVQARLPKELTDPVAMPPRPNPLPECAPRLCTGQLVTWLGDMASALRQANRMLGCIAAWEASRGDEEATATLYECARVR